MTKSAKSKKEKNADFTKRRLKLGKGKQAASNAVDTSFKARSIALPQQSITISTGSLEPTTKRRLTLDALLAHLRHYAAGTRRDALHGLQELLGEHSALIEPNLSKLVNGCVRLINDEDASVRRSLHSLLAWLLPRIPREHLVPHAPTLLLFTASAQSHIFPEIRIDAISIIDLLLGVIPEQVVAGFWNDNTGRNQDYHGRKVLDGFLGLLNIGTRFNEDETKSSRSVPDAERQATTASKARILKSFSRFLFHALQQPSEHGSVADLQGRDTIPLWYLSGSFKSHEAFLSFANLLSLRRSNKLAHRRDNVQSYGDGTDFYGHFPLCDISENQNAPLNLVDLDIHESCACRANRTAKSLCRTIHPVLVSSLLDAAPSVFSPSQASPETELELTSSLLEIARSLYGCSLRDNSISSDQKQAVLNDLSIFVAHMFPYFPFGENRMFAPEIKSENAFQQMNLMYCELFSLQTLDHTLDLSPRRESRGPTAKRRKLDPQTKKANSSTGTSNGADKQAKRVREFVVRYLSGSPSSGASATLHPLGHALTAQTYTALLPTLWWLINSEGDNSDILGAVLQHAMKAGSSSGVKPVATEFVGRLVMLQSERAYQGGGSFRVGSLLHEDLQKACQNWFCHLPKVLWELGDKSPATIELILLLILRLRQRRSWINNDETLVSFCSRLVPFFTVQHATRGELRGPYTRIGGTAVEPGILPGLSDPNGTRQQPGPTPLKTLALDVASSLVSTIQTRNDRPRKMPPRTGGRAGDVHPARSGTDPVSVSELSASVVSAQAALRSAVDKAVSGTTEEAYWLGVSRSQ
ncbi:uncharacterized protein FOMMEDRAFT_96218 [Fomitiporia mediterranea MF3/22]|uniref:uncharacterized protein n=1 Tax=Fomitiporia mediterranea (strain MF3/22) TaxID=694068 RepID=UPI0004408106|nr:uncharacterized protein FOMMEDRAFT_96218 [Fomitiporia mediterranea MF3/22]EJC98686.1 hypothetical protein FOMMEDRAFT_96218 [Fomitiporia mediterranea MF3/22]